MYRVERVLDRDALEVARGDLDAGGEDEVDLLDGRGGEHLLQDAGIVDAVGGGVDLPVFAMISFDLI